MIVSIEAMRCTSRNANAKQLLRMNSLLKTVSCQDGFMILKLIYFDHP